jgi:hypothetical protein
MIRHSRRIMRRIWRKSGSSTLDEKRPPAEEGQARVDARTRRGRSGKTRYGADEEDRGAVARPAHHGPERIAAIVAEPRDRRLRS